MGVEYYIVRDETKQFYELGKALSHDTVLQAEGDTLCARILEYWETRYIDPNVDKPKWAREIADDIMDTIGLSGLRGFADCEDAHEHFLGTCGDYVLAGTVYDNKKLVSKTLQHMYPQCYPTINQQRGLA